jgi:tetratricopeptide (TPR) repeat protein
VYEKFAQSFPELETSKRGKLEKLRACLRAKYTERLTGTPTTSNSQVSKAHPTPNAPTPNLYENLGRKGVERKQFIGRNEKLKELHDLLQENSKVAITAAVVGMGGVGKTELAIQYAREHLNTYQGGVCWLPASDFALKLVEFARPRFFPNVKFDGFSPSEQVAYCWQHWAEGDVLLVLDNVTNYKQQVQPYLPESSRFKVLITTREWLGKPIVLLDLEALAPAEALDLLKSLLGNERIERELDIAAELCDWLGYLPLGLELVGRYLDHPTMQSLSIAQMLEELKEERLANEALEEADYEGMTAQLGVRDALNLSWKRLDENAQQLGCVLSLFALAPIPKELVERVYQSWRGEGFKPKNLRKPFWALNDLHLLKTDKETYSLHQLIREFFREKLGHSAQADDMKRSFATTVVAVARKILQQPTHDLIEAITLPIPHLVEVASHLTEYLSDEDLTIPSTGLGFFYEDLGFYQQAEPWLQQGVAVAEHRFGSDHPTVATSRNNLAGLYYSQGHYTEAELLYLQALDIDKHSLPPDPTSLAIVLHNLALVFESQGRYTEAEPLYLQALDIHERLLPPDHPGLAIDLSNLGNLYRSQERYTEAEPLYQQALNIARLLRPDHPQLATQLSNLGNLYRSQGRYTEAEPLYVQALDIDQRSLPPDHPHIATSLNNLAGLYESQGRYQKAEPLYLQALDIDQRSLPPDHPDLAVHLNNLAGLYYFQKRYAEAELLYKRALGICEPSLGVGHPHTISIRANYARFLRESISLNSTETEALQFPPSVQAILDEIQAIGESQDATPESGD